MEQIEKRILDGKLPAHKTYFILRGMETNNPGALQDEDFDNRFFIPAFATYEMAENYINQLTKEFGEDAFKSFYIKEESREDISDFGYDVWYMSLEKPKQSFKDKILNKFKKKEKE